jgi:Family of unknown function (DUF6572)
VSVDDPNVIDFVARDPSGMVSLIMVEGRDWDESDRRLFELQEKINAYVSFVMDGQLVEQYPELAGKPVQLELRCARALNVKTAEFLEMVGEKLEGVGLSLRIQQIRDPSAA